MLFNLRCICSNKGRSSGDSGLFLAAAPSEQQFPVSLRKMRVVFACVMSVIHTSLLNLYVNHCDLLGIEAVTCVDVVGF